MKKYQLTVGCLCAVTLQSSLKFYSVESRAFHDEAERPGSGAGQPAAGGAGEG